MPRGDEGARWLIQTLAQGDAWLGRAHPLSKHPDVWIGEGTPGERQCLSPGAGDGQVNPYFGPSPSRRCSAPEPVAEGLQSPGSGLGEVWPQELPTLAGLAALQPRAKHPSTPQRCGGSERGRGGKPLSQGSQLTLQRDDGEVLCRLGLAGGKALVGPRVALLRSCDEEGLIADPPDGDVVIHHHEVGVAGTSE